MAFPAAFPAEAKARIIRHMNNDHQDSLVRYLEHYAKLSSYTAQDARLADVSLTGMSIAAGSGGSGGGDGALHAVAFSPPLKDAAELRARVVDMDKTCRDALGRDAVTVKRYVAPHGIGALFAAFAFWSLLTSARPANFLPGNWLYDNLYVYVPAFARLNYVAAPYVFWSIVILHGLEAAFILHPKLRKHSVPFGSALYWKWIASDFFLDGFGTLLRFDRLIADEREALEAKKH